ncbi:MAG: ribonuclease HII, partial [Candidatus Kerfeldbacteria bacterium]|nr:ribonuclease HII [Candidatus Kerfeldbacteria bacterium]
EETALRNKGRQHIAGVDEAGKGSWAGPIVAGAVILPPDFKPSIINDSKKLTPKQREKMFVHIARNAVAWAVAVIPAETIDRIGIKKANIMALEQAVKKLHIAPHAVLVDAVKIKVGRKPVKAIIDGDAIVLTIAAASIVAKVVRDTLMDGEHRLYPQYDFRRHKGYGTAKHAQLLKRYGLSPIHRRSFKPMRDLR